MPLRTAPARTRRWALLIVVGLTFGAGCTQAPPTVPPAELGPRETLARLMELRAGHKYREMSALVVPERRTNVVDFLMALDDFLAANGRLGNWLSDHVGVGLAQTIDQSYVVDDLSIYAGEGLGVFSRHVELLDGSIDGDRAAVSFTTENRLPAKRAGLLKIEGTWCYDPGAECSPELQTAFHDLARGLDLVLSELEKGRIPEAELTGSPQWLLEKVQARLRHGVGLLSKAQATAAAHRGTP